MVDSFAGLYILGAVVCFTRTSIIIIKTTKEIAYQHRFDEQTYENIFLMYYEKILFQIVMMLIFPPSFWCYTKLSGLLADRMIVSSGLLTLLWLMATGIVIRMFFYMLTSKIKVFNVFAFDSFVTDKEFYWVMCPLLYGALFSIFDRSVFAAILAIVLGKYIWMDFVRITSLSEMKLKVISLFRKHRVDFHILFYQAAIMAYLLVIWYPVREKDFFEEFLQGYFIEHFLILGLFMMPVLDIILNQSMKSELYSTKKTR